MDNNVILYGAGNYAKDNWTELREKLSPICFCDSDKEKWGRKYFDLDILSPEDAKRRYPDAKWYVSIMNGSGGRRLEALNDLIVRFGIDKKNIINYVEYYYGKGCPCVRSQLYFQHDRIQNCCENPEFVNVPFTNYGYGDEGILERIFELKKRSMSRIKDMNYADEVSGRRSALFSRNNGEWLYSPQMIEKETGDVMCQYCRYVSEGFYSTDEFEIEYMQISSNSDSRCNFRCPYCCEAMPGYIPSQNNSITKNIIKTIHELINSDSSIRMIKNPMVCISFGEPALNPDLEEIINAIPGAYWQVLTNASVYSDVIQRAIEHGEIVMSLDSGTSQTFKRIKGVDCFEQVKSNLLKYREYGKVIPKFIVLEGINDNDSDVDGFVDFCKLIDPPRVEVVRDYLVKDFDYNSFNWPPKTMKAVARLFDKLKREEMNIVPVVFPDGYEEELMKYL